jgi:hypothetical protein
MNSVGIASKLLVRMRQKFGLLPGMKLNCKTTALGISSVFFLQMLFNYK